MALGSQSVSVYVAVYNLGFVVETRNYWLSIFSVTTWQEFLDHGAGVAGFPETRWSLVQRIKQGDYLLCYLTKVSRWIAVLEVISEPFIDNTKIWKDRAYPCRVAVKPVVSLTFDTGVPVLELKDKLTVFQNLSRPDRWGGTLFQTSPYQWPEQDGQTVLNAVLETKAHPVSRPINLQKIIDKNKSVKIQGDTKF